MSRSPRWKTAQRKATATMKEYREAVKENNDELAEELMEVAQTHIDRALEVDPQAKKSN